MNNLKNRKERHQGFPNSHWKEKTVLSRRDGAGGHVLAPAILRVLLHVLHRGLVGPLPDLHPYLLRQGAILI